MSQLLVLLTPVAVAVPPARRGGHPRPGDDDQSTA